MSPYAASAAATSSQTPASPASPASGGALAFAERVFDKTLSTLSGERQQYLTTINMMADRLSFPDATAGTFRAASWLAAVDIRDRWQDFFQEDPDILPDLQEQYPEVQPPRTLIATSNLCSLGLTLHKAHHLVKFDVDFLDENDEVALESGTIHQHVTAIGRLRPKFWKEILRVPIRASDSLMTPHSKSQLRRALAVDYNIANVMYLGPIVSSGARKSVAWLTLAGCGDTGILTMAPEA